MSGLNYEGDQEVPYWDGMNVINKESNRNTPLIQVSAYFFVH